MSEYIDMLSKLEKKRERGKNYTEVDKYSFLEILEDYIPIIENKKIDSTNIRMKNECWENIARKFNPLSQTGPRTTYQLKLLYDTIKKKVKKDKLEERQNESRSESGKFVPKIDMVGEKFLQITNMTVITEMENSSEAHYDSSGSFERINNDNEASTSNVNIFQPKVEEVMLESREIEPSPSPSTPEYHFTSVRSDRELKTVKNREEEIKLEILEIGRDKEAIQKDILILRKRQEELDFKKKEIEVEELKFSYAIKRKRQELDLEDKEIDLEERRIKLLDLKRKYNFC